MALPSCQQVQMNHFLNNQGLFLDLEKLRNFRTKKRECKKDMKKLQILQEIVAKLRNILHICALFTICGDFLQSLFVVMHFSNFIFFGKSWIPKTDTLHILVIIWKVLDISATWKVKISTLYLKCQKTTTIAYDHFLVNFDTTCINGNSCTHFVLKPVINRGSRFLVQFSENRIYATMEFRKFPKFPKYARLIFFVIFLTELKHNRTSSAQHGAQEHWNRTHRSAKTGRCMIRTV